MTGPAIAVVPHASAIMHPISPVAGWIVKRNLDNPALSKQRSLSASRCYHRAAASNGCLTPRQEPVRLSKSGGAVSYYFR